MCGITGLYNYPASSDLQPIMLKTIAHRGPDADSQYFSPDKHLALGHRRLSIIDLSFLANQPFCKDGWAMVFNGEIYNYQTLKIELQNLGATFQTHSDTEVLLEAWRYWGAACLDKLRGMFAFSLYEEATKKLYFARDPYGIKPFFYYHHGEQFAFASELKALLPVIPHYQINQEGLVASLMYVWLPDSVCMIKEVNKLPAGHWGVFDGNRLEIQQYYHFEPLLNLANDAPMGVNELEQTLIDSVDAHLIADVPVATFLSGGLDSSLITAMAAKRNQNLESFTIRFRDIDQRFEAMSDDATYARELANRLNIKLHEIEISPDIVKLLPQMVKTLDEPIGDGAAINTYLICQGARQMGTKVLLSGMGADELFGGYRRQYACMLAGRIQKLTPNFLRSMACHLIDKFPVAGNHAGYKTLRWLKRFSRFVNLSEEAAYRQSYTYYTPEELKNLLPGDLAPSVNRFMREHEEIYWQGPSSDQVNRMSYTDIHLFMLGLNLTYTDRASMAASTEVRVPFIDKEVVRAAFSIKGNQKIHGRTQKFILKKVAERWLPHNIIYRPKAGFSVPLRAWIRRDLKEMVDEHLLGKNGLADRGILNREIMVKMIEDDRKGLADYSQQIWQWLTIEEWYRGIK